MIFPTLRHIPICAALALVAGVWMATAAKTVRAEGGESRAELTARIERYLNGITTLRARFLQIAPTGNISRGTVLISRPGKLRIDYDPPVPVLIVTQGSWLMLYDKELEASSHTSLEGSMAGFLVRPKISLSGDVMIRELHQEKRVIRVTIVRRDAPKSGALTLVFAENPISLRQWSIIDGRGDETRIALENPLFNGKIEAKEFEFTPPEPDDDRD